MIEAAHRYLDGAISIIELHGAVAQCAHAAKMFSAHPAITALAQEWQSMVDRCWNEWGHSPNPLTDGEFGVWLSAWTIKLYGTHVT
jgi:hypothetical protein